MIKLIKFAVAICAVSTAATAGGETQQPAYVNDMPFPTQMKAYVPIRNFADMPTRADILANNSDQAMLQISN